MGKKPKSKSRKGRAGKLSRFPMSRKLEVFLAWLGGILVLAIVLFLAANFTQKYWRRSPAAEASDRAAAAQRASHLDKLKAEGIVVSEVSERETLFVDAARWRALSPAEHEWACAAAAERFGSTRCFVDDAAQGFRVGFYRKSAGYTAREAVPKPR